MLRRKCLLFPVCKQFYMVHEQAQILDLSRIFHRNNMLNLHLQKFFHIMLYVSDILLLLQH